MAIFSAHVAEEFARAVFEAGPTRVVEANSEFGRPLRAFDAPSDFIEYVEAARQTPHGHVQIAVLYPDMGGRAQERLIELDPAFCNGYTWRYETMGWGLIRVLLATGEACSIASSVTANSEKRAMAWQASCALYGMDPPDTWNWPAVGRHVRRLGRVLRRLQARSS